MFRLYINYLTREKLRVVIEPAFMIGITVSIAIPNHAIAETLEDCKRSCSINYINRSGGDAATILAWPSPEDKDCEKKCELKTSQGTKTQTGNQSVTANNYTTRPKVDNGGEVAPKVGGGGEVAPKVGGGGEVAPKVGGGGEVAPSRAQRLAAEREARLEVDDYVKDVPLAKDECKVSATIHDDYKCSGTKSFIKTADMTNKLSQMGASFGTTIQGAMGQASAAKEGTQSASYSAAAKTQKYAAMTQLAIGAANAYLGMEQYKKHQKHDEQKGKLENESQVSNYECTGGAGTLCDANSTLAKGTDNTVAAKIVDKFKLQGLNGKAAAQKGASLGEQAAGEQSSISEAAKDGATASFLAGGVLLMNGAANYMAAKEMKKAADSIKSAESQGPTIALPGFNPGADTFAPRTSQTITGNGQNSAATADAASEQVAEETENGDLGAPFLPNGPSDGLVGALPTPDKPTDKGPAPGGASGSFSPGGSTNAAPPGSDTEPTAKMDNNKGTPSYEGSAGSGGGGGGRGGSAPDKGPDLSSLLAQFLPKPEDEAATGHSILDYGGRRPAGSAPFSLLSKDANIFDRIHETYQDKTRRGHIGI